MKKNVKTYIESIRALVRYKLKKRYDSDSILKKISNNDFFLKYQPISSISGEFKGVEALIRWRKGKREPSSAFELIELSIRKKQIITLTNHIADLIVEDFSKISSTRCFSIAINVELDHINDEKFCSDILSLKKRLTEKNTLIIELSEKCFIEGTEDIIHKLDQLRREGIKVALDDFGSGFSALATLDVIPLDIVKLDSAFVNKPLESYKTACLIKSISDMCSSLGIELIVEGVSTEEQRRFLEQIGISKIQGYIYSKPLILSDLVYFIESKKI